MSINILSLLDNRVQVTPQLIRILGELLEREITRDDPEWAAAMALLTVSEKIKIMPSRRQQKENEVGCWTIVQQLVSSIPPKPLDKYIIQTKRNGEKDTKENCHL